MGQSIVRLEGFVVALDRRACLITMESFDYGMGTRRWKLEYVASPDAVGALRPGEQVTVRVERGDRDDARGVGGE